MLRTLLCALLAAVAAPAQSVLFLHADDFGLDKLGCYGVPNAPATPNLDALAARGIRFERYATNAVCSPTRCTILTGDYAHRHLIGRALGPQQDYGLDPTLPQLLPRLMPAGHARIALGKWHLSGQAVGGPWHPLLCGFELYAGSIGNFGPAQTYTSWAKTISAPWVTATATVATYATTDTELDAVAALQYLRGAQQPFLLWVNWNAIHAPFHYPPGISGTPSVTGVPESRAMAEALDAAIGRVLAEVDMCTTTVIFAGDNGSVASTVAQGAGLNHAGYKGTVYEGGVRAPLIIAGARVGWTGASSALVNSVDLHATMRSVAHGAPLSSGDSISLLPHLETGAPHLRAFAFAEWFEPNGVATPNEARESARDDRFALVRGEQPTEQLFDLAADPFQRSPLDLQALDPVAAAAYASLGGFLNVTGFWP